MALYKCISRGAITRRSCAERERKVQKARSETIEETKRAREIKEITRRETKRGRALGIMEKGILYRGK